MQREGEAFVLRTASGQLVSCVSEMTSYDLGMGRVRSMMVRNLIVFDLDIPVKVLVKRTLELAFPE